jgi:UDP-glucose 4-epimerase
VILIIGGMGFIGLNTALRLLEVGETVVITQYSTRRVPAVLELELNKRAFVARMDVTKGYEVIDVTHRYKVDSIISFAAPPARGISAQEDYRIYTEGLQNTLEAARILGLRRVSLASSTSVYGSLPQGPFREDMSLPIQSKTQIEAFKKAMEIHAFHYAARVGIDVVALRIGSIYGPHYYSMFNPMSRMCDAALKGLDPDFSDRPGGSIRENDEGDWTYVADLARGIELVHRAEKLSNNTYNVGSGKATSTKRIFEAVKKIIPGAQCSALKPGRSGAMPVNPVMDLSRIRKDVGYEPEYDIDSGMAAYVGHLKRTP